MPPPPRRLPLGLPTVVGDAPTYLSFDIDALDPAFAPGTGTPEIGGLASWQAQAILRRLPGVRFAGMDVVEVAPAYDVSEITALAAATVVWEYLALGGSYALRVCPPPKNALLCQDRWTLYRRSSLLTPGAVTHPHVPRAWMGKSPRAQQRRKRVLFDRPGQPWAGVV